MDKSIIIVGDALEVCERIFTNPVPLVYTRHTARFLAVWLLLLPMGMWEPFKETWNHIGMVPGGKHGRNLHVWHRGARGAARGAVQHPSAVKPL